MRFIAAALAAFFMAASPVLAQGATRCGILSLEEIEKNLGENHGEAPVAGGLVTDEITVRLFANKDRSTFTLVIFWEEWPYLCATPGVNWRTIPFRAPIKKPTGLPI